MAGVSVIDLMKGVLKTGGGLEELFVRMAGEATELMVASSTGQAGQRAIVRDQGRSMGLLALPGTPAAALGAGMLSLQPEPAMPALLKLLRSGLDGAVIVFDGGQVALDKKLLRALHTEYALNALSARATGWMLARRNQPFFIKLEQDVLALPVYLTGADAESRGRPDGAAPEQCSLTELYDRAEPLGAEFLALQYGLPEQSLVTWSRLAQRSRGSLNAPLLALETEVADSAGGLANTDGVLRQLRQLDRVWVLQDAEGGLVALGGTLDLFTSRANARALAHSPGVSGVSPRLVAVAGLFRSLGGSGLNLAVNRGSRQPWVGWPDTLQQLHK